MHKNLPSGNTESISVVIATYNRPDALRAAIVSVQSQTHPVSEIIVVGDHCGPATAEALKESSDPRIRYINLPERNGDQAAPNARGVIEATGAWVAFLNHDDLWFPDHLERATRELQKTKRLWCCGRAMFSAKLSSKQDHSIPVITEYGLPSRKMSRAFGATLRYMEPASSWVVNRSALLEAGNWPKAHESVRTPVAALSLRLWRRLGRPVFMDVPTVLKLQGALQRISGVEYTAPSPVHNFLASEIRNNPTGWFRGFPEEIRAKSTRNDSLESNWESLKIPSLPNWLLLLEAIWFRLTGKDLLEKRLIRRGVVPGELMDRILAKRTGEVRNSWDAYVKKEVEHES